MCFVCPALDFVLVVLFHRLRHCSALHISFFCSLCNALVLCRHLDSLQSSLRYHFSLIFYSTLILLVVRSKDPAHNQLSSPDSVPLILYSYTEDLPVESVYPSRYIQTPSHSHSLSAIHIHSLLIVSSEIFPSLWPTLVPRIRYTPIFSLKGGIPIPSR